MEPLTLGEEDDLVPAAETDTKGHSEERHKQGLGWRWVSTVPPGL